MKKRVLGLTALTLLASGAICHAAPVAARSVYFWSSAVGQQGLKAGVDSARASTWGNGAVSESASVLYENAQTLKITTRNFREGARFDLKTPLDIAPYRQTGYVRLRVHFRERAASTRGEGAPGGGMPGAPGQIPGGAPGQNNGFGGRDADGFGNATMQQNYQLGPLPPLGGMGGLPGEGTAPIITGPTPQSTPITQLLCTLVLDNGVIEGTIDVPKQWDDPSLIDFDKVHPDSNGWLLFALPLKEMHATPNASGSLQRLILSGDKEDSFFLTQAALVVESNKITVSIRKLSDAAGTQTAEITTKPGPLTLVAEVEAGAADPAIEWNFDADNVGNLPPANPDGLPDGAQPVLGTLPAPGAALPVGVTPGAIRPGGATRPGGAAPPGTAGAGAEGDLPAIGPRIDARGLVAKFDYPDEEQNYRVEVTVRDRSGKKEPVKASVIVHVRG